MFEDMVAQRTKPEFLAAAPHPFLVRLVLAQAVGGAATFKTQAISGEDLKRALAASDAQQPKAEAWSHVYPMVKSSNNPYQGRISIGRTKTNDIVIEHPAISKLHCIIHDASGSYTATDPGSRNGVTVNGAPLVAAQAMPLKPGDLIALGGVPLRFLDAAGFWDFIKRNPKKSA